MFNEIPSLIHHEISRKFLPEWQEKEKKVLIPATGLAGKLKHIRSSNKYNLFFDFPIIILFKR